MWQPPNSKKYEIWDLRTILDRKLTFNNLFKTVIHKAYWMLGFLVRNAKDTCTIVKSFNLVESLNAYALEGILFKTENVWNAQYKQF